MDWILQPWPWYVGGALVGLIMLALTILGKNFGFSSNFRTLCAAMGAGATCDFFNFDWKSQRWNLLFLVGALVGGLVSAQLLSDGQAPDISEASIGQLQALGFSGGGKEFVPAEIYGTWSVRNFVLLAVAGLLIGFGTRYAGGCTSGHAISGLSNLQWPSLVAVLGFFGGGLLMVHVFFPLIF